MVVCSASQFGGIKSLREDGEWNEYERRIMKVGKDFNVRCRNSKEERLGGRGQDKKMGKTR